MAEATHLYIIPANVVGTGSWLRPINVYSRNAACLEYSELWLSKVPQLNRLLAVNILMVRVEGFEPSATCSQSKCSDLAELHTDMVSVIYVNAYEKNDSYRIRDGSR